MVPGMASRKAAPKGKRYTAEERQKDVSFVAAHNAENGRGGATAASKRFGVSQLTVANWLKAGTSASAAGKVGRPSGGASAGKRGKVLAELSRLDSEIASRRKELDALEARFQKLKDGL